MKKKRYNSSSKSHVYLCKQPNSNLYKIGKGHPENRISSHNTGNPFGVELVDAWEVKNSLDATKLEKAMHTIFQRNSVRERSEWFRFDRSDVSEFCRLMDKACGLDKPLKKFDWEWAILIISAFILAISFAICI